VDIESFIEPEIYEEEKEELPESILAIEPEVQTIEELDSEIETCILPSNLQDMQKCIQIIKKNPGERKIRIGERIIEISDK
jgi:hypothetical protein